MEFWLVVGLILGVVLAWAAISDHRDRRYHHLRSHREMADDHREHLRDVTDRRHGLPPESRHFLDAPSRLLPTAARTPR
jgi:hypothetical protein